jgi:hypothetical protein
MGGRGAEKGPLQLDIGVVVSSVGGNSSHDRNQFHGLVSLFGIDFGLYIGLYIGPSYNLFQTIGPSIGIGLLIRHNGFLAAKLGIHFRRTFGLAMLIPMSNNRTRLLSSRLLGTGLDSFPSSGSSHYYPFGCQFRIRLDQFSNFILSCTCNLRL